MKIRFNSLKRSVTLYRCTLICLLLIGILYRCYWIGEKEGMHCDEVLSCVLCNYNQQGWTEFVKGELSGEDVKRMTMFNDPTIKGCLSDIFHLYISTREPQHTNFYYSLLRLDFLGFECQSIQAINFRAFLLNLLIFVLEFFVYLKLLKRYFTDNNWTVLCGLSCFVFMGGVVSNTIFNRPYALQELSFVTLCLWVSIIIERVKNGHFKYNKEAFLITTACLAFTLLTGYFAVLFVGTLGIFLLCEFQRHHQLNRGLLFFAGTFISSILVCSALYHSYYMGFLGDERIKSVLSWQMIWDGISAWKEQILLYTLYPVVLLLCAPLLIIHIKKVKNIPWIFFSTITYSILILLIAPYKCNRYIVAATPMILIIVPFALSLISKATIRKIAMCFTILVYFFIPFSNEHIEYLGKDEKLKNMLIADNSKVCVIQSRIWTISTLLPYINDKQIYSFVNDNDKLIVEKGDVVVIETKNEKMMDVVRTHGLCAVGSNNYYNFYKVK